MPADTSADSAPRRRAVAWLVAGVVLGGLLAARGMVAPGPRLPAGDAVVARVNDAVISRARLDQTLERLAADKRNALTDADRRHVLDRMIEEELLIQRGVEVGLLESDRSVRAALVSAMIESIVVDAASAEPDEAELRDFYARNTGYFARPERVHVQQILFRGDDAVERAERAHAALRGGAPFADVRDQLGDTEVAPLPDAPLPPAKLRDYIGPALLEHVSALEPGAFSRPQVSASGTHILRLVSREALEPLAFDAVRDQVAAEYRRREGDRALREYLDGLRSAADVVLAADAPDS